MWVLNCGGIFPCGFFESKQLAEKRIACYGLSGVLTWYPPNQLAYDWAVAEYYFTPKREHQKTAAFVGEFSSANQEHYHYESGKQVS